jgi:hypothetical protein
MEFRKFIILTFIFILFTPIGTISHEYGHIVVAKFLGYKTTLHYASMNWYSEDGKNKDANRERLNEFIITCGGVMQTIFTGTIGFIFLVINRRRIYDKGLKIYDWIAVFLCLFWLRQIFNPVFSITNELMKPDGSFFGGDELKISSFLELWGGTVSLILGVIGLFITGYISLHIIPPKSRYPVALSGVVGSALGLVLWMKIIGPRLLP